jgi:hypothetical protein
MDMYDKCVFSLPFLWTDKLLTSCGVRRLSVVIHRPSLPSGLGSRILFNGFSSHFVQVIFMEL